MFEQNFPCGVAEVVFNRELLYENVVDDDVHGGELREYERAKQKKFLVRKNFSLRKQLHEVGERIIFGGVEVSAKVFVDAT